MKYWNQRRYTAWYDPEFEIDSADYTHSACDDRLRNFVEQLRLDIKINGLKNPLLVTINGGKAVIHPGKCRAKALRLLFRHHAPAVVVDFDRIMNEEDIAPGCTFLDTKEKVEKLFSGDCRVEMSHRGLTIKKAKN
jgi:hypothetical protein